MLTDDNYQNCVCDQTAKHLDCENSFLISYKNTSSFFLPSEIPTEGRFLTMPKSRVGAPPAAEMVDGVVGVDQELIELARLEIGCDGGVRPPRSPMELVALFSGVRPSVSELAS